MLYAALLCTADFAVLGLGTGGCNPGVAQCAALSLTAQSTGFGGNAVSSSPLVDMGTGNSDLMLASGDSQGQNAICVGGVNQLTVNIRLVSNILTQVNRGHGSSRCLCGQINDGIQFIEVGMNLRLLCPVLHGCLCHRKVDSYTDGTISCHQHQLTILQRCTVGHGVALGNIGAVQTQNGSLLTIGRQSAANDGTISAVEQNDILQYSAVSDDRTQQVALIIALKDLDRAFAHCGAYLTQIDAAQSNACALCCTTGEQDVNLMITGSQILLTAIDHNGSLGTLKCISSRQAVGLAVFILINTGDIDIPVILSGHGLTHIHGNEILAVLGNIEDESDTRAVISGVCIQNILNHFLTCDGALLEDIAGGVLQVDLVGITDQICKAGSILGRGIILHRKDVHKLIILGCGGVLNQQCGAVGLIGQFLGGNLSAHKVGMQRAAILRQGQSVAGCGSAVGNNLTIHFHLIPVAGIEVILQGQLTVGVEIPAKVTLNLRLQVVDHNVVRIAVVIEHNHMAIKLIQNRQLVFHAISFRCATDHIAVNMGIKDLLQRALAQSNLGFAIHKNRGVCVLHFPVGKGGIRLIHILGVIQNPLSVKGQLNGVLIVVVVRGCGIVSIDHQQRIQRSPTGTQCTLTVRTKIGHITYPLIGCLNLTQRHACMPYQLIVRHRQRATCCQVVGSQVIALTAEHHCAVGIIIGLVLRVGISGQCAIDHFEETKDTLLQLVHIFVIPGALIAGNTLQGVQRDDNIINSQRVIHMAFVNAGLQEIGQTPVDIGHAHIQILLQRSGILLIHNQAGCQDQTGCMVHITVLEHTRPAVVVHSLQALFDDLRIHFGNFFCSKHVVAQIVGCHHAVQNITCSLAGELIALFQGFPVACPVFPVADVQSILLGTLTVSYISCNCVSKRQGLHSIDHVTTEAGHVGIAISGVEVAGCSIKLLTAGGILQHRVQRIHDGGGAQIGHLKLCLCQICLCIGQQLFQCACTGIAVSRHSSRLAEALDFLQTVLIEVQTGILIINLFPYTIELNRCVFRGAYFFHGYLIKIGCTLAGAGSQQNGSMGRDLRRNTGNFIEIPVTGHTGSSVKRCITHPLLIFFIVVVELNINLETAAGGIAFLGINGNTVILTGFDFYHVRLHATGFSRRGFRSGHSGNCQSIITLKHIVRCTGCISNTKVGVAPFAPIFRKPF